MVCAISEEKGRMRQKVTGLAVCSLSGQMHPAPVLPRLALDFSAFPFLSETLFAHSWPQSDEPAAQNLLLTKYRRLIPISAANGEGFCYDLIRHETDLGRFSPYSFDWYGTICQGLVHLLLWL